jgi:hypothetical protein
LHNWTKRNIDGAFKGNPDTVASYGCIFKNHDASLIFCFVEPL